MIHVLAIAGSLRADSLNKRLVRAAADVAPAGVVVTPFDLEGLPLYNEDLDAPDVLPDAVARFRAAIADADALFIATPEFNHGIPGVLANAIDWASRPAFGSPLIGKPVAIAGASPGAVGTARAQEHLKLTLLATLAEPLPHRGFLLGGAHARFDASGTLTDPAARDLLANLLAALARRAAHASRLHDAVLA